MTIASIKNKVVFGCDGTNTIFSFDFKVFKEEHLKVYIVDGDIETLLTLNTDYAVSGLSEDSGGKVMLTTPPSNGLKLVIVRELPPVQETSFRNQGPFFPEIHESAFDQVVMLIQQMMNAIGSTDGTNSRALFLGLADTDGQGAYRAKGNRIANLGDPINDTDAARVIDLKPFADSAQQAAQAAQQSSQKASEDAAKALDSAQRAEDSANSIDTSTFYTKTEADARFIQTYPTPPTEKQGDTIYVIGIGLMFWDGTEYVPDSKTWLDSAPVGFTMDWEGSNLPSNKWLRYDGSAFDPVVYPELAALNRYENNKLPNASDRYVRYIGNRTDKYLQYHTMEDAFQNFTGTFGWWKGIEVPRAYGAFEVGVFSSSTSASHYPGSTNPKSDGDFTFNPSRVARTSDETRPKTIMIRNRIVKAKP